jgi:hypothetical protein
MKRYKNHLIAAAVLSVLAVIGTIMNSRQVSAQGGPTVTIGSPIPLPVTGSTTVSGTVAATQSGVWNVGINGTPNVHVTNPATAPVLFLNVNDPGRIPYQAAQECVTGVASCEASFQSVPSNRRLVVQHVSIATFFSVAQPSVSVRLDIITAPLVHRVVSQFPATLTAGNSEAVVDQQVLAYVDAGQSPDVMVFQGAGTSVASGIVNVTGYLLDCTIAPCAAIAP